MTEAGGSQGSPLCSHSPATSPKSNHVIDETLSIRQRVFSLLDKNHELTSWDLCKLLDLDYKAHGQYVTNIRAKWKSNYRKTASLKMLSFHNARGWIYALKCMDRAAAVSRGWQNTRALNKWLLWADSKLGRLEWQVTGRVNVWVKKPATMGRVLQLLANAFFQTGLVNDVDVFDTWARCVRFKGAHLVYDAGERLPYTRIDYLKDALGVVVKTGDISHPTGIEIEFCCPSWAEKAERDHEMTLKQLGLTDKSLELTRKTLELNNQLIQQFVGEVKQLASKPKPPSNIGVV